MQEPQELSKKPIFPNSYIEVKDKGKYNLFRQFKDYNNSHPVNKQYNQMYQKINLQVTQKLQKINKKAVPQKTSDVFKLEQFLNNNKFGSKNDFHANSKSQTAREGFIKSCQTSKQSQLPGSLMSQGTQNTNKQNLSFYFIGGDRFDSQNKHLKKQFYDNDYNRYNHVVSSQQVQDKTVSKILEQNRYKIEQPVCPMKFNKDMLTEQNFNQYDQPDNPQQRRIKLKTLQNNINTQKQWYRNVSEKKRGQNILRNEYRSGIISIDNPENPQTNLYEQDYKKYMSEILRKQKQDQFRVRILSKYRGANEEIEIGQDEKSIKHYKEIRQKKPDMREFIASKKRVQEPFMQKFHTKTQSMFIPDNRYAEQANRTSHLEYQDKRNKDYDIISIRKV